jgi:hypothetical protein
MCHLSFKLVSLSVDSDLIRHHPVSKLDFLSPYCILFSMFMEQVPALKPLAEGSHLFDALVNKTLVDVCSLSLTGSSKPLMEPFL